MEPILATVVELSGVHADLSSREKIFHRWELGTNRADFDRTLVDDIWDIEAFGRVKARRNGSSDRICRSTARCIFPRLQPVPRGKM